MIICALPLMQQPKNSSSHSSGLKALLIEPITCCCMAVMTYLQETFTGIFFLSLSLSLQLNNIFLLSGIVATMESVLGPLALCLPGQRMPHQPLYHHLWDSSLVERPLSSMWSCRFTTLTHCQKERKTTVEWIWKSPQSSTILCFCCLKIANILDV